jgi:hypothetical protein
VGQIKAIETFYNGYKFRSRTEARWAVFFDHLEIAYEYEFEGCDLGPDLGWYLPDFWLPQVSMWAEVKGTGFSDLEKKKCLHLTIKTGFGVLMLDGTPTIRNYWGYEIAFDGSIWPQDYVLFEGHRYWLNEGRFFASTGAGEGEILPSEELDDALGIPAVEAARQARFDRKN